jgi:hypothetical protein
VNTVMNLRVSLNVGKILSSCATGSFSRRTQPHGVSYLGICQEGRGKPRRAGVRIVGARSRFEPGSD